MRLSAHGVICCPHEIVCALWRLHFEGPLLQGVGGQLCHGPADSHECRARAVRAVGRAGRRCRAAAAGGECIGPCRCLACSAGSCLRGRLVGPVCTAGQQVSCLRDV